MLDQEQQQYIDGLKASHPDLTDAVLEETLRGASWPAEDITEALVRYKGGVPHTIPAPPAAHRETPTPASPTNSTDAKPFTTQPITPTLSTSPTEITQNRQFTTTQPKKHISKTLLFGASALVLLGAIGAGAYYAYTELNLFKQKDLTEENFLEYLITDTMDTATFTSRLEVDVGPRDPGAQSYFETNPLSDDEKAMYARDADRFRDLEEIQRALNDYEYENAMFPQSLSLVKTPQNDPTGKPYIYTQTNKGTGYSIAATFETETAAQAAMPYSWESNPDKSLPIDKTVAVTQDSYISSYRFDGKPEQPKVMGLFDVAEFEEMIPKNFNAYAAAVVTLSATNPNADFLLRLDGGATLADATFELGFEARKKADSYYAIINKMPLLFGDMSAITGRWVHFTLDDMRNYGYGNYIDQLLPEASTMEEEQKLYLAQYKTLLEVANKHKLIRFSAPPTKETIEGKRYTRYQIAFRSEALLPFYEEASKALEIHGSKSLLPYDGEIVAFLKSDDYKKMSSYLESNATNEMWMDEDGHFSRTRFAVRYIPTDDARALKDKQINLRILTSTTDINKPIMVETPTDSTSFDTFIMELTGLTKEELQLEAQAANIEGLRQALDSYKDWTGSYPESLNALTQLRKDTPSSSIPTLNLDSVGFGDFYLTDMSNEPFIEALPTDIFTKSSFVYTQKSTSDYELTYRINIVPFDISKNPRSYYTQDYSEYYTTRLTIIPDDNIPYTEPVRVVRFENGDNTANSQYLSIAQMDKTDTDKDLLSDALEKQLGTDPSKKDSDNDGFEDGDELDMNSNPLGPGRLEPKESYFGMPF